MTMGTTSKSAGEMVDFDIERAIAELIGDDYLTAKIIELNDGNRWTFSQIADWLEKNDHNHELKRGIKMKLYGEPVRVVVAPKATEGKIDVINVEVTIEWK